jgi:hypothetical protein
MRRVTRNAVVVIVVAVVLLLALGALPGLLRSGDPYYVTATPVDGAETDVEPVNVTDLPERRYPYTTAAIANGESEAYYRGPTGFKEAFTHSPFDEFDALAARGGEAVDGDVAYVVHDDRVYRLEVIQRAG